MLRGALLHLPGIGPIRAQRLRGLGVSGWPDLGPQPPAALRMGVAAWNTVLEQAARCDQACANGDIGFFARTLRGPDLWRVLAHYGDQAAFVDIETDGLHHGARVTVIACQWQGRIYTYVQNENLDDFLDLLQNVSLMVTFNGACFDVPMILRCYNIPELPCAHVDLRRVCYHAGWRGGLKAIEVHLGLQRPPDLLGVDGAQAVELWMRWQRQRERAPRDLLVRYCAADALALRGVTGAVLCRHGCTGAYTAADQAWADLDQVAPAPRLPVSALPVPHSDRERPAAPPPRAARPPAPTPAVRDLPGLITNESDARRRLREMLRRRFAR